MGIQSQQAQTSTPGARLCWCRRCGRSEATLSEVGACAPGSSPVPCRGVCARWEGSPSPRGGPAVRVTEPSPHSSARSAAPTASHSTV